MTTTTKTDDLSRIKDNLASKIAEHQADIEQTQSLLQQARMDVESFSRNRANVASDLAHVQSEVTRLSAVVAQAKQDAEAVVGTSLATEKLTLLKGFKAELGKAQTELANLTSSLTKDDEDIAQAGLIVQALVQKLNELQAALSELTQTYQRFDQQHYEDVKSTGLAALQECNDEVANLESQLKLAKLARDAVQMQLARDLLPFETITQPRASATLIQHAVFEDAPAVQLLGLKLHMAQVFEEHGSEIGPNVARLLNADIPYQALADFGGMPAYRQRRARIGQNNDYWEGVPALRQYEAHLAQLQQGIADLRRQQQQRAAQDLLKQASEHTAQDAPIPSVSTVG